MKSRAYLLAFAVLALGAFTACGGKKHDSTPTPAHVRVVNATKVSNMTLTLTNTTDSTKTYTINAGLAAGSAGSYTDIPVAAYSGVASVTGGALAASSSFSYNYASDTKYTAIAYERNNTIEVRVIADGITAPSSGFAILTAGNPAPDAGPLDVYVVPVGTTSIDGLNPTIQYVYSQSITSVNASVSAGNYDIIITAYGKQNDVRGKISGVSLTNQEIALLLFTSTKGGALVDTTLIQQGGSVTVYPSTLARIRLMGTVTASSSPSIAVNAIGPSGSAATYPFPFISPKVDNLYSIVAADTTIQSVSVTIGSNPPVALTPPTDALAAGNDYTLLVYGPSTAPAVSLLTDNNQSPTSARIRLINVDVPDAGKSGVITLTDNNLTLASQLPYGTASPYITVNTGTSALATSSPDQGFQPYSATVNVGLYGVYSLVVGGSTTLTPPQVWLVKDR